MARSASLLAGTGDSSGNAALARDEVSRFGGHVTSNTLGYGLSMGVNAAGVVLLTRAMGVSAFGQVKLALVVVGLLSVFTNWTSTSVTRFGREEMDREGRLGKTVGGMLLLLLGNLAAVDLAALLFRRHIGSFADMDGALLAAVAISQNLMCIFVLTREFVRAAGRMHVYGLLATVPGVVNLAFYAGLWAAGRLTMGTVAAAWTASNAVSALAALAVLRGTDVRPRWPGWARLWRMVDYSYPFVLTSAMYLLLTSTDLFFLKTITHNNATVGSYGVASTIYQQMVALPNLVTNVLFPILVGLRSQPTVQRDVKHYIERVWPNVVFPIVLLFELPMALARPILLVAGRDFVSAETALIVLSASAAVAAVRQPLAPLMAAFDIIKPTMVLSLAQTLVNVVLCAVWVGPYGMTGGAAATLAATLAGGAMVYWYARFFFQRFNHKVFLALASVAVSTGLCLAVQSTPWRMALWLGHVAILAVVARAVGVFIPSDAELAARIGAPAPLAEAYRKAIRWLAPPAPGENS